MSEAEAREMVKKVSVNCFNSKKRKKNLRLICMEREELIFLVFPNFGWL